MMSKTTIFLFVFSSFIATLSIARPSSDLQIALLNEKNWTNSSLPEDRQAYEYQRVYEDRSQKPTTAEITIMADLQNDEPKSFQSTEQNQLRKDTEVKVDSIDEWIVVNAPIVVYIVVICVILALFAFLLSVLFD
ncbi:hypothetical protein M3Y94_01058800 [Aphelenchoides besseyi]|nr:hypothetical protein M3Y94_01058800 [Aphelenchoides besseyi]